VKKSGAAQAPQNQPAEDLSFAPFEEGGDPFAASNSGGDDLPF